MGETKKSIKRAELIIDIDTRSWDLLITDNYE